MAITDTVESLSQQLQDLKNEMAQQIGTISGNQQSAINSAISVYVIDLQNAIDTHVAEITA